MRLAIAILQVVFFGISSTAFLHSQPLSWRLIQDGDAHTLEVKRENSPVELLSDSLQVFVGERTEWPQAIPAMIGKVEQLEDKLLFHPGFSFRPGVRYSVFLGRAHRFVFEIPLSGEKVRLTAIYPSASVLPANLLKIYLQFSAPMAEGRVYDRLTLTNTAGDTIQQAFVPLQPELWSEDRQQLTLWLDPGRVKRGLLSHETHGVVIEQGQQYTLTVHPEWKDVQGNKLDKPYRKIFVAGPPDYQQLRVDNWHIQVPEAGTNQALIIDFGEPLDHALASRLIQVEQTPEFPISGTVELKAEESRWYFQPAAPWPVGTYKITIKGSLEDLAGNNLNRPFDQDLERKVSSNKEEFFVLHFEIKEEK